MLMSGMITVWSRVLTPVNLIKPDGGTQYLNVNQSWEMWKDAAKLFKSFDILTPSKRVRKR